eukprot:3206007-Lingulodinium_polyedra.AAC.1
MSPSAMPSTATASSLPTPLVEPTEEHEHMSVASVVAADGDSDVPFEKRERTTSAETGIWCAHRELWLNGQE